MTLAARSGALLLALFALSCGGSDDPNDDTDDGVQVDTFNVGLAGAFIPFESERRQPLVDTLAASESDIVCLQEVWRQQDKDLIAAGVASAFPHVVAFTHDLSTAIDDPTDQTGAVPPAASVAPCTGGNLPDQLEAAVACVEENCSTDPRAPDAQTTSAACAEDECISAVGALLLGDDQALDCYACLTTSLPTETFDGIRELCSTQVGAGLAFRGQSGVMILSKHPLTEAEAFVMPGTWNRRIVASARATLPDGGVVDVHCNHLTPIFRSLAFPYTGDYGADRSGADAWAAEQTLQAEKLVEHVASFSGDTPALILGDMNAGRPGEGLEAEGVATMDALEAAFTLGTAEDYEPRCTYCPDNTLGDDDSAAVWIDHIFLANVPRTAVRATERIYDEAVVSVDDTLIHLSDHYGLRSVIALE